MGFGKSFKKALGGAIGASPLGSAAAPTGLFGPHAESAEDFNQRRKSQGLPSLTQEQLTTANLFSKLSTEQQKDLLINNPNIETALGGQFFDPTTNTIRLTESDFTKAQRLRQEGLAAELSGSLVGDLPSADNETLRDATFQLGKSLRDPGFKADRRALEQQLADQGLVPGSEAFNEQINRLEASQGNQLNQLSLASVAQGIQTGEAQRAARFNEISSLLGQQQVGGIGFNQFQPQKSGLDLFGAEQAALNRNFQADQANKDRSAARRNAIIGAVGSAGSSGAAAFSDIRLKENVEKIGISLSGIPIYEFDYIDKSYGEGRYEGVMAQDLKDIKPEAIIVGEDDIMQVNYAVIDVDFKRVDNGDK